MLAFQVENTIRWRYGRTPEGELVHESNARIVRWSDGSLSLHLGDEIFDIHKVDIQSDFNYLFIREGSGLQGQSSLRTKLTFRYVCIHVPSASLFCSEVLCDCICLAVLLD